MSHTNARISRIALAGLAVAGLALPASAAAAKPELGNYTCAQFTQDASSFYYGYFKLQKGQKYRWSTSYSGLKSGTPGKYKVSGKQVKWLSGQLKKDGYVGKMRRYHGAPAIQLVSRKYPELSIICQRDDGGKILD